ncbi:MAG TPA: hypothetical protein VES42_07120, partial [Pilimelia sp.]|nr:hypothetical protein [Pilimelia sp.]
MADDVDELAAGAVRVPDCAGCPVELVDAAGILAAAEVGRVQLAPGGAFPPPVRRVRFWVAPAAPIGQDGRRGYFLDAEIESADAADGDERPGLAVLGNDPIGVLLARRLAAGDPWAARLVDGADRAVAGAYR